MTADGMGHSPRVPLYDRLPEIYRIRDSEQTPPGQLQAYLGAVEQAFGAIHESIEALYDDFFIETCDDWVIPYIADLLGASHLAGDACTLRADVADTIALRRRKGTLGALERLARNLTGWPAFAAEMRPNLGWTQHLNHQRPDAGGRPPYGAATIRPATPRIGGTVAIRDPAMLALTGSAFDPFAVTPDVKRADDGARHVNLPNLALYLWRLAAYRIGVTRPLLKGVSDLGAAAPAAGRARYVLRVDLDPLDRAVTLFNLWRRPEPGPAGAERLAVPDAVAAPIPGARLESGSPAGNPAVYIGVDAFDASVTPPAGLDLGETGLQLYLPASILDGVAWRFRADNLCAWEGGLRRRLALHEISLDPQIGRMLIGLATAAERDALVASGQPRFFTGHSYGAVGPVGAHPVSRGQGLAAGSALRVVDGLAGGASLQDQLAGLDVLTGPLVVEIRDSLVHDIDPTSLPGAQAEGGEVSLRLGHSVTIRAASGARPVIRLARPLRLRPTDPAAPVAQRLSLRLEGVFVTRAASFPAGQPLIARLALSRLECEGTTLDPGGHSLRDGSRAPVAAAIRADDGLGFADPAALEAFDAAPEVVLIRSVAGAIALDPGYRLILRDSIIDAGAGPDDPAGLAAVGGASDNRGPALSVSGATFFGPVEVREARGAGAVFCHPLRVWNHQTGCLRNSFFASPGPGPGAEPNRLPPHRACLSAADARLVFTSVRHGQPGYGQISRRSDPRLLTRGPGDEQMGAFGFLGEAHKTANLQIRLREFMPVGMRPLVVMLT